MLKQQDRILLSLRYLGSTELINSIDRSLENFGTKLNETNAVDKFKNKVTSFPINEFFEKTASIYGTVPPD
jgi:hypothetical protein